MARPSASSALAFVLIAFGCDERPPASSQPAPSPPVANAGTAPTSTEATPMAAKQSLARYDVEGRSLAVSLTVDKPRVMVSEPVFATLVFSGDALEVEVGWMGDNGLGRPENYRLAFVDADGATLPGPDPGPQFGGQSWTVALAPGRDHRARLLLAHWVVGLKPGRYTLRGETTIRVRTDAEAPWRELPVAVETPVEVVADDAAALGRIFRELGAVAVGERHDAASEALRQLEVVRDPQVIPEWLRIAELPDYAHKFAAARALALWDDDRALAAIVRIAATQAADLPAVGYATEALRAQSAAQLRVAAAQALATSPHRDARSALLALKDDPEPSVRLTVVHRLAKLTDPAAHALLTAFAADGDATVRGEARRYMAERR
ncbi:HEAT repeat domain-containing protein [Nannocystis sp. ILAH1]|uniref:HEAT repeat domain-containing protein n=1 Tax=Nannocystis sp. ILAH1 TaxID=2996789 RepID=UPI00226E4A83|nr:HEAT repeat domain-containing protein [Nannocystis sp. ILAH1]MCY0986984.1 HEAT repeat domain-containing protein [Nannocystis sp. ILAH1]